jgi:hypothetical protein
MFPWLPMAGAAFVVWVVREISQAYERGREAGEKARPRPAKPTEHKAPRRKEIDENPYPETEGPKDE